MYILPGQPKEYEDIEENTRYTQRSFFIEMMSHVLDLAIYVGLLGE